MKDILDDYIESRFRYGEAIVAGIATGIIMKAIDAMGMADRIDNAFDWFVAIAAIALMSYFIAGSIHDVYDKHRESKYTVVHKKRQEDAA